MPNRIIRESITSSDTLDELSYPAETLFYRLIVVCDDFGRTDARPIIIRSNCFPLRSDPESPKFIKTADIQSWLNELSMAGLITLYQVDGRPYLQMVTWQKYQRKRADKSKYPAPEEGEIILPTSACGCVQPLPTAPVNDNGNVIGNDNENVSRKKTQTPKNVYGEFSNVRLAGEERQKLIDRFGEREALSKINELSEALKSRAGYAQKYTDHYATILSWARKNSKDKSPLMSSEPKIITKVVVNE